MPLMIIKTSVSVPEDKKEEFLTAASRVLVEAAGKKESHVMVLLEKVDSCMGSRVGPAAFAEVRSMVGLTPEVNHNVSQRLCDLLEKRLGIPGGSVYVNFTTVPQSAWGWDHGIVVWDHDQKKWVIK